MPTVYAIQAHPSDDESFILPDGSVDVNEALQMMQHRAEEWIDERIESDNEEGVSSEYSAVKVESLEIHVLDETKTLMISFNIAPVNF